MSSVSKSAHDVDVAFSKSIYEHFQQEVSEARHGITYTRFSKPFLLTFNVKGRNILKFYAKFGQTVAFFQS